MTGKTAWLNERGRDPVRGWRKMGLTRDGREGPEQEYWRWCGLLMKPDVGLFDPNTGYRKAGWVYVRMRGLGVRFDLKAIEYTTGAVMVKPTCRRVWRSDDLTMDAWATSVAFDSNRREINFLDWLTVCWVKERVAGFPNHRHISADRLHRRALWSDFLHFSADGDYVGRYDPRG